MAVSDRGRLPADLHAAYVAANGGAAKPGTAGGKPAAKKAAGARPAAKKKAPGKKAPAKSGARTATTRTALALQALAVLEVDVEEYVSAADEATQAEPTPSPQEAPEVGRLIALEVLLPALAARVTALEQRGSAPAPAKQSRFRRRG